MIPYTPPAHHAPKFNCPICHAFASQHWSEAQRIVPRGALQVIPKLEVCQCQHCEGFSIWREEVMLYPSRSTAPPAHVDTPSAIKADYEEAADILSRSPRGAAALLRLAIQKLTIELGQPGKDLNTDIAALVKQGLPVGVQRALDSVRVIGNEAVHPGVLDVRDDPGLAHSLFDLVNVIVQVMISQPKQIDDIYSKLPESKRTGIENRDRPTK